MSFRYIGGFLSSSYNAFSSGLYQGLWTLRQVLQAIGNGTWSGIVPNGQAQYTSAGTYTWTAPAAVTSVSVVCIGPTLNWANNAYFGRGGGGLGWKNNISVVPGNTYTVVVGDSSNGNASYFISAGTVSGGSASGNSTGGTYVGDGGGNGGDGGSYPGTGSGAGGGGTGGYAGNGGNGGASGANSGSAAATNSGGGGGGAGGTSSSFGGGGGGVSIYGKGPDGAAGIYGAAANYEPAGGRGGSYGANGSFSNTGGAYGPAQYGGGMAGTGASVSGGPYGGAVRIIYGTGRAFPSTLTGNL
jgi:hypothetical protein